LARAQVDLEVPFADAALGATKDVLTLDGVLQLKVPPGCQPGAKLRLRGKGLPTVDGRGRGNQIVTCHVLVPTSPGPRERELLEELRAEAGKPRCQATSAFDRLKGFFGG